MLLDLARDPRRHLLRRWNWKSALLSSLIRSTLFFIANLRAGPDAALAAFLTELLYRGATAGFYGALTQALREARPLWAGTLTAAILLPAVSHAVEFAVHWLRGTPRLADSLVLSVSFTAVSTCFNLFAMRHGALTVGDGSRSIGDDLCRMPRLSIAFVADAARETGRGARRLVSGLYAARRDRTRASDAPGRP